MTWFKNLKIKTKLVAAAVAISLIAGIVGAIGVYNSLIIAANEKTLYDYQVAGISVAATINDQFENLRYDVRDLLEAKTQNDINQDLTAIQQRRDAIDQNAANYEKTIRSQNVKDVYGNFTTAKKDYFNNLDTIIGLVKSGKSADALALFNSDAYVKTLNTESDTVDKLMTTKVTNAKNNIDTDSAAAKSASMTMIIIVVVGMILSISLGIYLGSIVSKPMKKLVTVANHIADGDLSVTVETGAKDETGEVAEAFRRMKDKLNDVLGDIQTAAEQVATGSRQVSDSSIALSQGATEQASSIEQLTASIEQISSQTKLNATNATQVNELADNTKDIATRGTVHMESMVKAMEDINESSNNISRIIKVIDDIAFQTNILALNAAVEAARAGQYGRGFAVVADEVRNLAARSANAASETTTMIEGTITKVKSGTETANGTAAAFGRMVVSIDKMVQLIGDIATASNEQSIGIDQINQGIQQVSQVVQTNSATSEESAAASEELSGQAELLKTHVETFKLEETMGRRSAHAAGNIAPREPEAETGLQDAKPDIDKVRSERLNRKKIILTESEFGKY